MRYLLTCLAEFAGVLALGSLGYYGLCLWSAWRFQRESRTAESTCREWAARRAGGPPAVSILKPLRGADPEMYEAFRSHCRQDYPQYELIFGVADEHDPAVALVERLKAEFPERSIELAITPLALGANLKISNLVQMLPHAQHEYLLVSDSDILVPHDYLNRIVGPFADPKVGMVTALYRGAAGRTLGSKLEALGISTDFVPGVLAARELEGMHFALGSTMAFPRRALEAIGGFEPLLDYLADDYQLGSRIAGAGYEVVLSDVIVDSHLPDYDLRGYWSHQLRWARGIRDSRRGGYLGMIFTFGLPWALLALALSRGTLWAWVLLAVVLAARISVALAVGRHVLQDPQVPARLWLLPWRDLLGLVLWAFCYAGHRVTWRGDRFLLKHGKLQPIYSRFAGSGPGSRTGASGSV